MRASLRRNALSGLFAAATAALTASPAEAFSPFLVVPDPAVAEASPAFRYANMSNEEAIAELDRRHVLYTRVEPAQAPGVRAPIRLTGRLHGVYIHSSLPPEERVTTMFEILDARLALALDDFAAVLERHDIDEVVHYTMYRPNVAAPSHGVDEGERAHAAPAGGRLRAGTAGRSAAPISMKNAPAMAKPAVNANATAVKAGKPAPKAAPPLGKGTLDAGKSAPPAAGLKQKAPPPAPKPEITVTRAPARAPIAAPPKAPVAPAAKAPLAPRPAIKTVARRDGGLHQTTWAPPGTRHPAGLAIDVGALHKRDGRWLSVARHFHGKIGAKTCGDGAPLPDDPDAREIRSLVCEASDLGLFTYALTPNYNAAHADHYHLEIKPGVRWFLYH